MTPLLGPTSGQTCFSCGDPLPVLSAGGSFFFFHFRIFFVCFSWGAPLICVGRAAFFRGMAPFFCRGGSVFSFLFDERRGGLRVFFVWGTPLLLGGGGGSFR